MLDPQQTKKFIEEVLQEDLKPYYSRPATYQLLFTCAAESDFGTFIEQIGGGPAKGFFQIEPNTEKLVWKWAVENNDTFFEALVNSSTGSIPGGFDLKGNFRYQVILARANYYSWPAALPIVSDPIDNLSVQRLSKYWKQYWNTVQGAGRVSEAVDKYYKFVGLNV